MHRIRRPSSQNGQRTEKRLGDEYQNFLILVAQDSSLKALFPLCDENPSLWFDQKPKSSSLKVHRLTFPLITNPVVLRPKKPIYFVIKVSFRILSGKNQGHCIVNFI